jgi:hypothetical protein
MSDEQIRHYAQEKGFRPSTLERWLGWNQPDKEALFDLARAYKIGENHLRDLMDWLEEISLRDCSVIRDILASGASAEIASDPRLGRADKIKRIKEQIRRLRFPRLSEIEDRLRAHIRELKVQPQIKLSVPSGLEGGRLHLEFQAANLPELQGLITKLAQAAQNPSMGEIFSLLNGETSHQRERLQDQN